MAEVGSRTVAFGGAQKACVVASAREVEERPSGHFGLRIAIRLTIGPEFQAFRLSVLPDERPIDLESRQPDPHPRLGSETRKLTGKLFTFFRALQNDERSTKRAAALAGVSGGGGARHVDVPLWREREPNAHASRARLPA
jgi:hypothetical protein